MRPRTRSPTTDGRRSPPANAVPSIAHTNRTAWQVREREVRYALAWLQQAPHNQSPYNYLRAFVRNFDGGFRAFPFVLSELEALVAKDSTCAPLLALMVDVLQSRETRPSVERALAYCSDLMDRTDVIRRKYWHLQREAIVRKLDSIAAS